MLAILITARTYFANGSRLYADRSRTVWQNIYDRIMCTIPITARTYFANGNRLYADRSRTVWQNINDSLRNMFFIFNLQGPINIFDSSLSVVCCWYASNKYLDGL